MDKDIDSYNYTVFEGDEDYMLFRSAAGVGTAAPDFEGTLLATGQCARLREFWRAQMLLVKFGSFT